MQFFPRFEQVTHNCQEFWLTHCAVCCLWLDVVITLVLVFWQSFENHSKNPNKFTLKQFAAGTLKSEELPDSEWDDISLSDDKPFVISPLSDDRFLFRWGSKQTLLHTNKAKHYHNLLITLLRRASRGGIHVPLFPMKIFSCSLVPQK